MRQIDRNNASHVLEKLGRKLEIACSTVGRVTEHVDDYMHDVRSHPYFPEMKELVASLTLELVESGQLAARPRALEIGAGGGNLTEALVGLPLGSLIVSDLDIEGQYVSTLERQFGGYDHVHIEQRDLLDNQPERDHFDVVYSCAVDHHIPFDRKQSFYRNVRSILRPGGLYITADVLLSPYLDGDRAKSVAYFHAIIVDEAMRRATACSEVLQSIRLRGAARISYQAWLNELRSTDEYKVSLDEYRADAETAGFDIQSMTKLGPHDTELHGVYVSVFQRPL